MANRERNLLHNFDSFSNEKIIFCCYFPLRKQLANEFLGGGGQAVPQNVNHEGCNRTVGHFLTGLQVLSYDHQIRWVEG